MKKLLRNLKGNQKGFTMIELLMVILLVSILAAVSIPQFLDFQTEAKEAATKGILGSVRTALANQKGQMILRCGASGDDWPALADLQANDITSTSAPCTPALVPTSADRKFTSDGIPANPFDTAGLASATTIHGCAGTGCDDPSTACSGDSTFAGGWCYDPTDGEFYPNTANNAVSPEYAY